MTASHLTARYATALLVLLAAMPPNARAVGYGEAPWVGTSFSGIRCDGSNPSSFGPYDYTIHRDKLKVVENAHFSSDVEQLASGINAAGPTTDIDYTLKTFPNHHRALNSAIQFHFLEAQANIDLHKGKTGYALRSPVECYLQRAVNYSRGDATSHMLFASFLHRTGSLDVAAQYYEKALELSPSTPNIEYNYALLLTQMERYGEARKIARRLYSRDFPLPGLKNQLKAANQWE